MQTNPTGSIAAGVDRDELDRHISGIYRDVASEAARDLHFPTGRPLAEALGYPAELLDRLPANAVNSFAGVGYHLGLARLLPASACSISQAARASTWLTSRPPAWICRWSKPTPVTASPATGRTAPVTSTARTA